ncbi:dehydrogenase/reductase SDR family member on chromosome X-like [Anthonomus grandis grandis]|uniref:dehydrogenase/reductase SDR family member on chromosome X-like n=1 Tax=Anthonomus grandis grandis TaxID=2921223 RepID=UPI00216595AE|nr:dehydrogenase/reductase SDR family member on chromosome X-like [Anthonomus grandis grandis]XP_050300034.1 dehydrogenase/reductase SDR family member on chromosome X-like [Anthonomus grandis grandis]
MIVIVGCSIVILATIVAIMRSKKPLKVILAEAKFEMLYNILGSKYLMHDFLMRKKNRVDLPMKSGKTALITGGTRGIGLSVVKHLLKCDINVIIGCRNVQAAENLLPKIREEDEIKTGNIEVHQLDISVLESVRKFAEKVKSKHEQIDYLINNAGIMFGPQVESRDGYESQFATNYLGHFLLTHLLLPELKKAGTETSHSRIVNVSSCAHVLGNIHFEDINFRNRYIPAEAYAQSKLAQILFSNFLNALMVKEGEYVQVHSVHPGVVNTDLFNDTSLKTVAPWLPKLFFKTPDQGSYPILYACLSPLLEGKGGTYIHNCVEFTPSEKALDADLQEKLFNFTKKLLDIEKFSTLL